MRTAAVKSESTHDAPGEASHEVEQLLTYADLSRITGESVMTQRRRKMLGTGPKFLLVGRRHVRFRPSDVLAWLTPVRRNRRRDNAS
jgi:predicted DNA-binding transcriptional regulator AlpA